MKADSNEARLVSLTNHEILLIISVMRKTNPSKDDEQHVVNIVEKLQKTMKP